MRLNIETIQGPYWDERFAAMLIPGNRDGVAVLREDCLEFSLASIGREGATCILLKMRGDPLKVVSRVVITEQEFLARLCMLDTWPFNEGLVRTPDILDGESLLVKRVKDGKESRLAICVMRPFDVPSIEEFADKLDAFVR